MKHARSTSLWAAACVAGALAHPAFAADPGAGCTKPVSPVSTQVLARVNDVPVTRGEVEFGSSLYGSTGKRKPLERQVDLELLRQAGRGAGLDQSPAVVQARQATRERILATARMADHPDCPSALDTVVERLVLGEYYGLRRVGDQLAVPGYGEVQRYYDEHPALFTQRRVFETRRLLASRGAGEALPASAAQLRKLGRTLDDVRAALMRKGYATQPPAAQTWASEQVPMTRLDELHAAQAGDWLLWTDPDRGVLTLVEVLSWREAPVALAAATPAIRQYLITTRREDLLSAEADSLRQAARVERAAPRR